jgi:hydrogenase nickel incorporation protein HypA/HybF
MHEMSVISSLLRIVLAEADKANSKSVVSIRLQVGEFSDLQAAWMQRFFDIMSRGTKAEGATIKIEKVPGRMKCSECLHEFNVSLKELDALLCPKCGEKKMSLISGRQYYLKAMEVI